MEKINHQDLICMDEHVESANIRIELAYALKDNLLFGERIYHEAAKLWLHKDLGRIVLQAAKMLENQNLRLVLYDGLRTTDAQSLMLKTQRVQDNPHWLEEPRLLSPPGKGAHPRAMAIDCSLETFDGQLLDMGTAFDFLAEDSAADSNPAHREYPQLSEHVIYNRSILDTAMSNAATEEGLELLLVPQEWWDFRFLPEIYNRFEPLSDADLPQNMRLTAGA
ncbi:MAG: M15 family metallopeptidase [Pseudomonadota bacterium]